MNDKSNGEQRRNSLSGQAKVEWRNDNKGEKGEVVLKEDVSSNEKTGITCIKGERGKDFSIKNKKTEKTIINGKEGQDRNRKAIRVVKNKTKEKPEYKYYSVFECNKEWLIAARSIKKFSHHAALGGEPSKYGLSNHGPDPSENFEISNKAITQQYDDKKNTHRRRG